MSVYRSARIASLYTLRACGVFALARALTRRDLRILCYHGFSVADEHEFRPSMWITRAEFDARITHLRQRGYPFLPLEDALRRLEDGTLPPCAVVITIDDGFYGTAAVALPVLQQHGVPATLYLTTYYVVHQHPIYNLALPYLFWRARPAAVDLGGLGVPELDAMSQPVAWGELDAEARGRILTALIVHGSMRLSRQERHELIETLAARLGVDFESIAKSRMLHLVNEQELRMLVEGGISIELHTHRHWSPGERDLAERELRDNNAAIISAVGVRATHFCYPSGRVDDWQPEWLEANGVRSATTCYAGFNRATTPRYLRPRLLDGHHIAHIEFEAEMAGILELARRVRRWLGGGTQVIGPRDPAERRPELPPSAGTSPIDQSPFTRLLPNTALVSVHGRKLGLLRHMRAGVAATFGLHARWQHVNWSRVTRLVFVCKGNICRSAFAEALAHTHGVPSTSFGLEATSGMRAASVATEAAQRLGIDLRQHLSKEHLEVELGPGDLLVAFEPRQARALDCVVAPIGAQVTLLGLHVRPIRPHIEDPFGLTPEYFLTCFETIETGVATLVRQMGATH